MPDEQRVQRPPVPTSDSIALILPLDVPAYARAAEAVRAGFLAAAEKAGAQAKVMVISHKEDGVLGAFELARSRGVRIVVGPLLRDDLKTLAIADPEIPWTIALNQLEDRSSLPPAVYSFALTIDSDARVLARQAQFEGVRAIDVISGDTPLMKRFAAAFASEWIAGGGLVRLADGGMTPTRCCSTRRLIMFAKTTKVLVTALVLAGTSIAFVTSTSAAPSKAPSQTEQVWMDRASKPDTNAGGAHDAGGPRGEARAGERVPGAVQHERVSVRGLMRSVRVRGWRL